jgi:ACS family tartrate transporter-like MFS transporter
LTVLAGKSTPLVWCCLALCHLGQRTIQALFWAIPPIFLGGTAAAAGIAFINSIGNLGGQVGPWLMGHFKQSTGDYTLGLLVLAGVLLVEAAAVLCIRIPTKAKPA